MPSLTALAPSAVLLCWLLFGLLFLLHHRRVRRARGASFETGRASDPSSMLGLALEGVAIAVVFSFRNPRPDATPAGLALLLAPASVAFSWAALRRLDLNWRIQAVVTHSHQLVTTGPYAIVRHPIYTGLFGLLLATGLAVSSWPPLLAASLVYVLGTLIRARAEDRLLSQRFGAEFDLYRRRVPAFIPLMRLRKRKLDGAGRKT